MGSKSGLRGPLGFDATSVKATHYQWETSTLISAKIYILNTFVKARLCQTEFGTCKIVQISVFI